VTFIRPTTTVEDSTGIASICGDTTYSIHSDNSGTNFAYTSGWAVITGPTSSTFTLTIDTTVDLSLIANEASVTIPVYIKSTLDSYTAYTRESYTLINIVISQTGCNCAALAWDDPTSGIDVGAITAGVASVSKTLAPPTANTAARSTNAAFDKCYLTSADCATTGAYDSVTWDDGTGAVALPSWITFTSVSNIVQTVAINPPDGTVVGSHSLIAVFNPTNGNDKTYTALTFTITCQVTSWTVPSAPTSPTFDLSYAVFEAPLPIDISTLAYV